LCLLVTVWVVVWQELESATQQCNGFHMNICLSYGGRAEIINACKKVAQEVVDGVTKIDSIGEATFGDYLCTKGLPGELQASILLSSLVFINMLL
jgi:undecaprenyl diphosphate synthase